ncbi:MAG: hypothetical protein P4L83_14745 [Nevskia sp.]|nr:hypothetical protein [Nevskia sp.]
MKRIVCAALPLLLCACGATKVRPDNPPAADWHSLKVAVRAHDADDTSRLRDEVNATGLFGPLAATGSTTAPPDLVISAIDEKVVSNTTGPFCLDYALSYLTAGIVPEICDQQYQVDIDVSVPATGRAARLRAELTQRRFIGLFGAVTSMFGDWHFFGPTPGDPVLARSALLGQRQQIDALLSKN